jgi:hypothetical protein
MKVLPEVFPTDIDIPPSNEIQLPQGIIGFAAYKRAELLYLPDHLPFLWMKMHSPTDHLHFIVIEPGGIVPGYEPEIFDEDAEQLGISDPSHAMVLNVDPPESEPRRSDGEPDRAHHREPPDARRPPARHLELLSLQRAPRARRKPPGVASRPHRVRPPCSFSPEK